MFNFIYLFLITRLIFCCVFGLYVSQRCETMALIHDRRLLFWFFRCLLQMLFVAQGHVDNFYTVIDTFKNHYDIILNFFVNRATNANAESFNAKVKAFRAQFRGVTDIPFFLYRLMKLCA